MSDKAGSPFDSIESAHEFVTLLAATVGEAKREVEADVQRETGLDSPRRLEALRTALYSMEKLELHMNKSRRILNDLSSLRRLLFDERSASAKSIADAKTKTTTPTSPSSRPREISISRPRSEFIA